VRERMREKDNRKEKKNSVRFVKSEREDMKKERKT
jgi:hypothetical protein